MAIGHNSGQMETSKHSSERLSKIRKGLVYLAECRQASISVETIRIFSDALMEFDVRDAVSALKAMGGEPKPEFETPFPTLGTIIERIKQAARWRTNPVYKPCGECIGGMVYVDASGKKCNGEDSPNRTMAFCVCRREYNAMKKELQAVA